MNISVLSSTVPGWLKTRGAALLAVAVLQLGVLGGMVGERVHLLQTGREIVLPAKPVDPRDLFKGDYVQLQYSISNIPAGTPQIHAPTTNEPLFVTIEPQPDGDWHVAGQSKTYPTAVLPNQLVLRARRLSSWSATAVRYGIERYYVPETTGGALEKLARDKKLGVIVAVDGAGNAAIKGLSADGKRIYDEPLF